MPADMRRVAEAERAWASARVGSYHEPLLVSDELRGVELDAGETGVELGRVGRRTAAGAIRRKDKPLHVLGIEIMNAGAGESYESGQGAEQTDAKGNVPAGQ
jgi:hypothetical protein